MNEKKNIDRLFQEKFKDFEVAPPEFVWDNIQEALQEKKKRRVIPIWIRLSGVAAILVVGGLFVTPYFNGPDNINTNPVVIDNPIATPADALTSPAGSNTPGSDNPAGNNSGNGTGNDNNGVNTAVASGDEKNDGATANDAANGFGIKANPADAVFTNRNNAVASENTSKTATDKNSGKKAKRNSILTQTDAVAATGKKQGTIGNNHSGTNAPVNADIKGNSTEGIAVTNKNSSTNNQTGTPVYGQNELIKQAASSNEGIATNTSSTGTTNNTTDDTTQKTGNTIIDKNIPETEAIAQTAVDTAAVVAPENELEKLLREQLEGKKDEDKALAEKDNKGKWNIKPQVAPIFYNSLTSGSPIDESFASNGKSYDNDLSIGIGLNYAINDRITIRSGINTVNLNYSTNDIAYYASLNQQTTNIAESRSAANIVVQNPGDVVPVTFVIDGQPAQTANGSMLQKTGYIEVPLEMSYSLLNRKFGINLIGGVSTLFLNQNNVSVVSSEGLSTTVGEAENLNNVHFSTNLGVGFKYRFWDAFEANFEPMFKYQVNTFSRDAGNFKPYFIGLYSGVSFSF
ncbi:hypothetical protein D3C87_171520 [compost metagenome]